MLNGTVYSGCTDPTEATARLVIVLVSKIQKSGAGDISIRPTEMSGPVKVHRLQRWDGTEMVRSNY